MLKPKLNDFQKTFLKTLFSKMLFFPAIWYFIWAIYPLATDPYLLQGFDLVFYIMLSLFNWLCFIITLLGAVAIEMIIANPELRHSLTHLERGKPRKREEGKPEKEQKKEKLPLF